MPIVCTSIKQRPRIDQNYRPYPFSNLFIDQITVDSHYGVGTELNCGYRMVKQQQQKQDMLLALGAIDHK